MDLIGSADRLPQIEALSAEIEPQIGTAAIAKQIAGRTGLTTSELRRLLVSLLNVYHTQVRLKLTPEGTVDAISDNLRRVAKTSESQERVKIWDKAKAKIIETLRKLYPDHPLETAYKAYRVATARQYELVGMRIFTDARPVFNEAGDAIVQTIISHVLSLDYHDGHQHRVVQFNLDATDVTDLKEMCERAVLKAGIIKRDLKASPWPTTIFREPTDQAVTGK